MILLIIRCFPNTVCLYTEPAKALFTQTAAKNGNLIVKCPIKLDKLRTAAENSMKANCTVEEIQKTLLRNKITGYSSNKTAEEIGKFIKIQNYYLIIKMIEIFQRQSEMCIIFKMRLT